MAACRSVARGLVEAMGGGIQHEGGRRDGVESGSSSNRMRHVLSALVQNQPGVLAHVSGMFASRGFNIESLAVGETETPTSRGSPSSSTATTGSSSRSASSSRRSSPS